MGQLWDATGGKEIELNELPNGEHRAAAVNLPGGRSTRPVAFRRDGRVVAVAFASGIAEYDTTTGKLTEYFNIGEVEGTSRTIEYSPDGLWIVTATGNGFVQVWAATGKHLACPKFGRSVTSATFSADGRRVATAGAGDATGVWDAHTGRLVLTVPAGADDQPTQVALSPDGTRLAVGRLGGSETTLWAVPPDDGGAVAERRAAPSYRSARVLRGTSGKVATFSGDGARLISAGGRRARVWDAATGQPLSEPLDHGGEIVHAGLDRDGARAYTAGGNRVRVWDVRRGQELFSVEHAGAVRSAAFSPDGGRIVTAANAEKTVRVRDARTGEVLLSLDHPGAAYFVRFTPDGGKLFTLAQGEEQGGHLGAGSALIWDARTGKELRRRGGYDWLHQDGDHWTRSAALSPDGKKAATCQLNDIVVWEIETGKKLVSMDTIDAGGGTMAMAFSPDGQQLLTLDATSANLWSTKDGELLFKLNVFGIRDAAFLPDGKHVLATAELGNTGVYDLSTGECVVEAPAGFLVMDAPAIGLSPDGKRFAVGGAGQTVVWEAAE